MSKSQVDDLVPLGHMLLPHSLANAFGLCGQKETGEHASTEASHQSLWWPPVPQNVVPQPWFQPQAHSQLPSAAGFASPDCQGGRSGAVPMAIEPKALDLEMFDPSNTSHPEVQGSNQKKRMLWTTQMKILFEEAVNKLGIEKATPKPILEYMRHRGYHKLNRENVASHLQKYRAKAKLLGEGARDSSHPGYPDGVLSMSFSPGDAGSQSQMAE